MFKNKNFNIIYDYFKNNINSHSYIFYTNDFFACQNDVNHLIKEIFKVDDLTKITSDYIVIEKSEKKNILKEDINVIKNLFQNKSYLHDKRVYLIEEAHKLNSSSANMILKFLEEPFDGVIAIFITTNLDLVLSTIRSRCELVNVFYESVKLVYKDDNILLELINGNRYENIFKVRKILEKYHRNELINLFNDLLLRCYNNIYEEKNIYLIKLLNNSIGMLNNNVNIDYVFDYIFLEESDCV